MGEEELKELFELEDDSQEGAVDLQDDDVTDEGAEETAEEVAKPQHQSAEDNHNFAQARKQAEAELRTARQRIQELEANNNTLIKELKAYGYDGSPQEIADRLAASRENLSVEEIRKRREAEAEKLSEEVNNHPSVVQAKQFLNEQTKALIFSELKEIQKVNPDIKTLDDLRNFEPDKQQAFDALVKSGFHIDKAYGIVFGGRTGKTAKKPDTRQNIKQVNGSATPGPEGIPSDELELARAMMPDASKKELDAYWQKYKSERK